MFKTCIRFWRMAALLTGLVPVLYAQNPLPTDVTILTQEDFKARPLFSVGDALRGIASIKIEQDGSRGTRQLAKMRGLSSSDNVLVLLDGRPLTHEYNAIVDLAQFPLGMVERIEITRGGASLAYSAEAVGGAINIVTLRPKRKGLQADLGTGVGRDGGKNSIGKIFGRSNAGDITYAPNVEASGGFSKNEDFQTTNHFGNFTRSFNGRGYWGAEYYFHDSRIGLSNGTPVAFDQWNGKLEQLPSTPGPQRTQESQHVKAFLAVPLPLGGTTYASFTDSSRNNKERVSRGGVAVRDEDSGTSIFDFSWRRRSIDIGWRGQRFKRQIFPEDARYATQNGFYGVGNWRRDKWTVAPGVRYDRHSVSGGFFSPRLALIYSPAETFSISATSQRAHRIPSFEELYLSSAVLQNPKLKDEKSVNADLGFDWKPGPSFGFKTTGFLIRKSDLITPDASSTWTNNGTEKAKGLEVEARLRLGRDDKRRNEFFFFGALQNSRRSLPTVNGAVDAAMSPRHLLTARWNKHFPRSILLTNEIRYQSEQFELDNRQGVKIPGSYVWNGRFSLRVLTADMYFAVENITRRRFAETIARSPLSGGGTATVLSPQPERTFWIGVSIRYFN